MILLLVFFLMFSCQRQSTGIPFPQPKDCSNHQCDTSKLEVVWQKPLSQKDTGEMLSSSPILYNGNVLFTRGSFGETCSDTLKMFDAKNGNLIWTWSDYFFSSQFNEIHGEIIQSGKYALFTTEKEFYCVDLSTGKTNWRTYINVGVGYPGCSVQNGYVYQPRTIYQSDSTYSDVLYRSKVESESWEPLYNQKTINHYKPYIQCPVIWTSSKGEDIALFQIRYVNFETSLEKADFVAYNITQKKGYFRLDNIDEINAGGSIVIPYIKEDRVFIATGQIIYAVDLNTQNIIWQKKFTDGGFNGGQTFIIAGNDLYVKLNSRILYKLDSKTGSELNIDSNNGSDCNSQLLLYNKLLFYTCSGNGKIYAIDINNGNKIWSELSPNNFKGAYNNYKIYDSSNIGECGIAIDSLNNYLYASDYYFAMCLKLPKH